MLTTVQRNSFKIGLTGLALVPRYVSGLSQKERTDLIMSRAIGPSRPTVMRVIDVDGAGHKVYEIRVSNKLFIHVWGTSEGECPELISFSTLSDPEEEGIEVKDLTVNDLETMIDRLIISHTV